MNNLFFRTSIAPYRIDFYNALYKHLNMKFFFYRREDIAKMYNANKLEKECYFTPHYLKGYELGGNSRKLSMGIYRIIKSNKPNIVIVPEFQILVIQVWIIRFLLKKKFRIISMCDDSFDMLVNKNSFTVLHVLARKILMPLIDDIIVVEPRVEKWFKHKYGKGIWFPIIRNEEKERKEYERVLPLSNQINKKYDLKGKKIILYVGRLVEIKNVTSLLSAANKLREECVIVIVGYGKEEEALRKQAKRINKRVIFTGKLDSDELKAWYNISDIFALLSTQEPFGAVTNEALLAGNYVVISEKAGSSCLVEENINGFIVDPYDIKIISNALEKLLSNVKSKNEIISLKSNLMFVSFQEEFKKLIKAL